MVNTKVTAQDKTKDGDDLNMEDAWNGGRWVQPALPLDDKLTRFVNI